FSDDGYDFPSMEVNWHKVETDHTNAGFDKHGQGRMFRDAALGVQDAAAEKRDSLPRRVAKMQELIAENPNEHAIIWHDLEDERRAIQAALPEAKSVWGSQDMTERENRIIGFSNGEF